MGTRYIIQKCVVCGEEFIPTGPNVVTCSDACWLKRYRDRRQAAQKARRTIIAQAEDVIKACGDMKARVEALENGRCAAPNVLTSRIDALEALTAEMRGHVAQLKELEERLAALEDAPTAPEDVLTSITRLEEQVSKLKVSLPTATELADKIENQRLTLLAETERLSNILDMYEANNVLGTLARVDGLLAVHSLPNIVERLSVLEGMYHASTDATLSERLYALEDKLDHLPTPVDNQPAPIPPDLLDRISLLEDKVELFRSYLDKESSADLPPALEARLATMEKRIAEALAQPAASGPVMNYCERLKLRTLVALPCGEREECFRSPKCDRCPADKTKAPSKAGIRGKSSIDSPILS